MKRQKSDKAGCHEWMLPLLCVAICTLLLGSGDLRAEDENASSKRATRITADKVIYSRQDSTVRFEGNVYASRDTFEIWCNEMTVYVNKEGAAAERNEGQPSLQSEQSFERIVAEGDVRLQMEGRTAESRKAIYESGPKILTLTGDVHLQEERNTIQGHKVKLYLKEDRSEIMSGEKGQVEAVFFSSEEDASQ